MKILFLDIHMKGINGIEVGKKLRELDKNLKIIYLTSHSEYTHEAFSVHAFSYLIKPIEKKHIHREIDSALMYYSNKEEKYIEFQCEGGLRKIYLSEIIYFEYKSRNIRIVLKEEELLIKEKIGTLYEKMAKYKFLMPHKSFVVNYEGVKSIKGYEITMINGDMIPLSQKKSVEFRENLNRFIGDKIRGDF